MTNKRFIEQNKMVAAIVRKLGVKYVRQYSNKGKTVCRTKFYGADFKDVRQRIKTIAEIGRLGFIERIEYRGLDPKHVGPYYADYVNKYLKCRSLYVYYK